LAIGAFLYEAIGKWLIDLCSYDERVDQFRALYAQWAGQSFSQILATCGLQLGPRLGEWFPKAWISPHTRSRIMKFTSDRHSGKAVKAVPTF
jgi:hypothetical protein